MSDEIQATSREDDEGVSAKEQGDDEASGAHGPELDRLPPPAFPPGMRRAVVHRPVTASEEEDGGLAGALISPDEPIRRSESEVPDDAFISPDEPFRRTEPHAGTDDDDDELEEGVVTGIGEYDPSYFPQASGSGSKEAGAVRMAEALEALAAGLRKDGSVSLMADTRLTPFGAMIRGMIAGFLAAESDES